jgi:hypothetical protein
MTLLRKRMLDDLELRGLSEHTQELYVRAVRQLAEHFERSPDQITDEELRQYLLYLRKVSPVDPDASPMRQSGRGKAVLGYHDHYVVDGGKARIILHALVTPASIMDNTPMLYLVEWVKSRWQIDPKIAVGDAKHGTIRNIVGLENAKINAYMPIPDLS